jgi:hypothetical protein
VAGSSSLKDNRRGGKSGSPGKPVVAAFVLQTPCGKSMLQQAEKLRRIADTL